MRSFGMTVQLNITLYVAPACVHRASHEDDDDFDVGKFK